MKRRDFITLIGGAAASVAQPLAARAQQPSKVPLVGFLGTTTAAAMSDWTRPFEQRLGEHGWIQGRTIKIEYRWAEAHPERYAEIAAEFVKLPGRRHRDHRTGCAGIKKGDIGDPHRFCVGD